MLHAPVHELGSILPTARFCFFLLHQILHACIIRYFVDAVHACAEKTSGNTIRHRFCTAARRKVYLDVTGGLAGEFATTKQATLLHASIMAILCDVDRSFVC